MENLVVCYGYLPLSATDSSFSTCGSILNASYQEEGTSEHKIFMENHQLH